MVSMESKLLYQLEILNSQNVKVNNQLSTGKAIQNGSEDTELYAYILGIENDITTYNNIETQLDKTTAYNDTSDSSMSEIKNQMDSVNAVVLESLNSTVDAETKTAMAKEVEGMKESMLNQLNQEINGEYLFAGDSTSTQPFVMDENGKVSYEGSYDNKTALVDKGVYKEQGITGIEAMYYTTSKASPGNTLEFTEDKLLLDEDGNTYEFIDHDLDGVIDTDRVYKNGELTSSYLDVTDLGTTPPSYTALNTSSETIEAKRNYFDDLDEIINALNQVDSNGNAITEEEAGEVLSNSLEKQESAYSYTNTNHAILGAKNKTIENHKDTVSAKIANFEVLYEESSSADLTKAAIQAKSLEITYSSLYSTISKVNSLALVNYL